MQIDTLYENGYDISNGAVTILYKFNEPSDNRGCFSVILDEGQCIVYACTGDGGIGPEFIGTVDNTKTYILKFYDLCNPDMLDNLDNLLKLAREQATKLDEYIEMKFSYIPGYTNIDIQKHSNSDYILYIYEASLLQNMPLARGTKEELIKEIKEITLIHEGQSSTPICPPDLEIKTPEGVFKYFEDKNFITQQ